MHRKPRIGPRTREVHVHVKRHPGCTRGEVAQALEMPGSSAGAAVKRAIAAGLVKVGGRRGGNGPEILYAVAP